MRRLAYPTAAALAAVLAACGGDDDEAAPTPVADEARIAAASTDLPPRLDALAQAFTERGHDVRPVDTARSRDLDPPRPTHAVRVEFPARDLTVRAYRSAEVVESAFDPAQVRKQLHGNQSRSFVHLLVRDHVTEVVGCGRFVYFGPDVAMGSEALQEALRAADLCRSQVSIIE